MTDVFPLAHFFEFSAAANYATSLLQGAQESILVILKKYDFTELYAKKENPENKIKDAQKIVNNWEAMDNPEKKRKAQQLSIEGNKIVADFNKLKITVDGYLENGNNGVELKQEFWDHFKMKVLPLFPLAGTFSVIILLIGAFDEVFEGYEFIHLNTFFGVCFTMLFLVFYNLIRNRNKSSIIQRSILLNASLISLSFLVIGVCSLFSVTVEFPSSFNLTNFKLLVLIALSVILAGAPFIYILYRHVILNLYAWCHSKKLTRIKNRMDVFLHRVVSL